MLSTVTLGHSPSYIYKYISHSRLFFFFSGQPLAFPRTLLLSLAIPINPILEAQACITARLEDAAELERPWDFVAIASEEEQHLHRVAHKPVGQDGESESLARAGTMIRENLREGEDSFDSKTEVADD